MTKHEMVISILQFRYGKDIELCRVGNQVKPRGAGARKEYNKYMMLSVEEVKDAWVTAHYGKEVKHG